MGFGYKRREFVTFPKFILAVGFFSCQVDSSSAHTDEVWQLLAAGNYSNAVLHLDLTERKQRGILTTIKRVMLN